MCSVSKTYLTTGPYFKERLLKNTFWEAEVFVTKTLDHKDMLSSEEYY